MIPCFVISLPDCTERRDAIRNRLDGLGIGFELLDAVDGRQGLPPEYESQIDRTETKRFGRLLADADYACALSHINVYRRLVAEGLPYALILEDDAHPTPTLPRYLAGKYYEDAWVTQLYVGSYPYVRWTGAKRLFANHTSHVLAPILRGGAVAYIVSQEAARFFLDRALPVTSAADWPDCARDIVARRQWRVVHPLLCMHPSHQEQISGQSVLLTQSIRSAAMEASMRELYWRQKRKDLPRKLLYRRLPRNRSSSP